MRVALNGCGRIGKNIVQAWASRAEKNFDIVAINIGPHDPALIQFFLNEDSVLPRQNWVYDGVNRSIHNDDGKLIAIESYVQLPENIWQRYQVDVVIDASGIYTNKEKALAHINNAGAKAVFITAPVVDADVTIIYGYNHELLQKEIGTVISLGSCTTNAAIGLLSIADSILSLSKSIVIDVMTIHAYTNSQPLVDSYPRDFNHVRESRAGACNIIPTDTGASKSVIQVMPELAGKVVARAYRVPVLDVSCIEMRCRYNQKLPIATSALKSCIPDIISGLPHLLATEKPLVSADFIGCGACVTVDLPLSRISGDEILLVGWYDNEWGYSQRVIDAVDAYAKKR